MCETPGKMYMHDMVKIDTTVFEQPTSLTQDQQWSQISGSNIVNPIRCGIFKTLGAMGGGGGEDS